MILWQCGSIKYFRPVALSLNTFEFPLEKHKSMQSPIRNVERNGPFFTLQKSIRPMLHCANYKNDLFYWFFFFFLGVWRHNQYMSYKMVSCIVEYMV